MFVPIISARVSANFESLFYLGFQRRTRTRKPEQIPMVSLFGVCSRSKRAFWEPDLHVLSNLSVSITRQGMGVRGLRRGVSGAVIRTGFTNPLTSLLGLIGIEPVTHQLESIGRTKKLG